MSRREPPRPLLAVDTSTATGSVAVGHPERILAEAVVGVSSRHAEALLPTIDFVLGRAGVAPDDLGGVVVAGGPGSFTGIRIAGATAKGLVRALGVPLYAYPGLLGLAAALGAGPRPVCALFDARRGEVYAACYAFPQWAGIEMLLEPVALPLDRLLDALAPHAPLYAGEGALRYRERIADAGGTLAPPYLCIPRAGALLWLAGADPGAGRVEDPAAWEPAYLREWSPGS